MDRIEHLKELFQPVFERNSVILYDLVFRTNGSERTLEVSIMKEDGSMDLDTCALVSEQISEILDKRRSNQGRVHIRSLFTWSRKRNQES